MSDHDQRFKTLLQEFFGDFLRLFFAPWAKRLDCDKVEWLDGRCVSSTCMWACRPWMRYNMFNGPK